MSNCQDYIVKMNQYLDGELPVGEIADLLYHLDECEECRRRFEALRIVAFEMRYMPADPPAGLHDGIMKRIARERPLRRRRLTQFAALAACGALLIAMASVVAPRLSNIYLFGSTGSDNSASDSAVTPANFSASATTATTATAGAAQSEPQMAAPETETAPAPNPEESKERSNADGGTGGPAASAATVADTSAAIPAPTLDNTAEAVREDGYDHSLFIAPQLRVSDRVGFYIIAKGDGDPAGIFPIESIISEREVGEAYVFVPNTAAEKAEAERLLIEAGFTLYDNVESLPETDEEAEYGLIVVFENR